MALRSSVGQFSQLCTGRKRLTDEPQRLFGCTQAAVADNQITFGNKSVLRTTAAKQRDGHPFGTRGARQNKGKCPYDLGMDEQEAVITERTRPRGHVQTQGALRRGKGPEGR